MGMFIQLKWQKYAINGLEVEKSGIQKSNKPCQAGVEFLMLFLNILEK